LREIIHLRIGRSGPNLEPGTMRVYVTNGPRNGFNIGGNVGPCPATGDGGCWVVFMAFLKPLMPRTHTVPGFRLGPDPPSLGSHLDVVLRRVAPGGIAR